MNQQALVGIVMIGRNEGDRFRACLASLPLGIPSIYVDSGSTDDSITNAETAGVHVVTLSSEIGFTAARARNLGWRTLVGRNAEIDFIQFIDGDCTLDALWMEHAMLEITADQSLAVVFGRRRERFPNASIYNAQCDREWDVAVGDVRSCGGDALVRVSALKQVDGYNSRLIAGEEPDLCLRLRAIGWSIKRISAEMTLHDAAISNFGTWWKRAKRAGYAYVEHVQINGKRADPDWVRAVASMSVWAILLPALLIFFVLLTAIQGQSWIAACFAIFAVYPVQYMRLVIRSRKLGLSKNDARSEAFLLMIAKFAHCAGAMKFVYNHARGKRATLLEYK